MMRTEKWIKITLKNPLLRKFRKNMRLVLKLAVEGEDKHLTCLIKHYERRYNIIYRKVDRGVEDFIASRHGVYSNEEVLDYRERLCDAFISPLKHLRAYRYQVKEQFYRKRRQKLTIYYNRSILQCSNSSACESNRNKNGIPLGNVDIASLNKDMVWDPIAKEWICSGCFDYFFRTEELREDYKRRMEKAKKRGEI